MPRPSFQLQIEAPDDRDDPATIRALRALLKTLARRYGFRVRAAIELKQEATTTDEGEDDGHE